MWRFLGFCLCLMLLTGCGNADPNDGAVNVDGEDPPASDGTAVDGSSSDGTAVNGEPPSTDPGHIVDPTGDDSEHHAKVQAMDIDGLVATLGDEDAKLADAAGDELAARGADAVQPLMSALGEDNEAVVLRATFVLGRLGSQSEDALPKLKELAEEADTDLVQATARFAIDAIEGN